MEYTRSYNIVHTFAILLITDFRRPIEIAGDTERALFATQYLKASTPNVGIFYK